MKTKIRKLIPLAILAVVAVVALSSCDAMLDAIFSKNSISVDVAVGLDAAGHYSALWSTAAYNDGNNNGLYSVAVSLSGPTNVSSSSYTGKYWDGYYEHYYFTFNNLADGAYYPSVSYSGYYWGSNSNEYVADSSGIYVIATPIDMPYTGSYATDSTGHSLKITLYPY
jgi:hypothetical protein